MKPMPPPNKMMMPKVYSHVEVAGASSFGAGCSTWIGEGWVAVAVDDNLGRSTALGPNGVDDCDGEGCDCDVESSFRLCSAGAGRRS